MSSSTQGSTQIQTFHGKGKVVAFITAASRAEAIKAATAPLLPNCQAHGEPCELYDMAPQAGYSAPLPKSITASCEVVKRDQDCVLCTGFSSSGIFAYPSISPFVNEKFFSLDKEL